MPTVPFAPPSARDVAPARPSARVDRRAVVVATVCAPLLARARRAEAKSSLIDDLRQKRLNKPVFNGGRPRAQAYPDWLEGEWRATIDFAGYEFPSAVVAREAVAREATTPGFQKLSLAYAPDVGREGKTEYRMRFARDGGDVIEDRGFNLREIVDAYVGEGAVEAVEYDARRDANRTTIRLKRGASNNAERIELFTNARDSETRESDGTFFALESLRQVTLGYSTSYGVARMVPTDYTHVWTFTPLPDVDGVDGASAGEPRVGVTGVKVVNRVKATLSTAGYLQPNDALKYTASDAANPNGAPVPRVGAASQVAFEPVVLYSHVLYLERVGCVP